MTNEIIESWKKNASEWIKVIDSEQIASRKFTNNAIIQVLKKIPSQRILDMGCGEGWLTRSITKMGKESVGIDAIDQLLVNAGQKGPEPYYQISYEEIMEGYPIPEAPYQVAVFNFSLYQDNNLTALFRNTAKALSKNGRIVVQTLHPYFLLSNGLDYKSQTIDNSWKGLTGNFTDGHPWYARTFADWFSVFTECHMNIIDLKEVSNNEGEPVSLILQGAQTR